MSHENKALSGFEPDSSCDNRNKCEQFGYCWAYSLIKAQFNPDASSCNHPQAQQAREDIRDVFKPGGKANV